MKSVYVRLMMIGVVAGALVLCITRMAMASSLTPQQVYDNAEVQMTNLYNAFSARTDATVIEAQTVLVGRSAGDFTMTERFKRMGTFVGMIEKDAQKVTGQFQRINSRARAQLERLNADEQILNDLNFLYGGAVGSVNGARYFAARDIFVAVGDYMNFID